MTLKLSEEHTKRQQQLTTLTTDTFPRIKTKFPNKCKVQTTHYFQNPRQHHGDLAC